MQRIDYAKALGVAVAILAVNILIAVLVVLGYSLFIDPGHSSEYYDAAALRIAPWCSHIAGTALFVGAGYWFTKRRPERNGYQFAISFTALYALVDAAIVGFVGVFCVEFFVSMVAKFVGALIGAHLATRNPR